MGQWDRPYPATPVDRECVICGRTYKSYREGDEMCWDCELAGHGGMER
jgi:hypothetical protein